MVSNSMAASTQALNRSGGVQWRLGHFDTAVEQYRRALLLARERGDLPDEAHALFNLGTAYDHLGRYEDAQQCCTRALEIHRATADRHSEATVLGIIGSIQRHIGDDDAAETYFRQALDIHRDIGDRFGESLLLRSLGAIYRARRRFQEAFDVQDQALELCRQRRDRESEIELLNCQGETLFGLGELRQSLVDHAHALNLAARHGEVFEQARAHDGIAQVLLASADTLGARTHWAQALRLYGRLWAPQSGEVARRLKALDG